MKKITLLIIISFVTLTAFTPPETLIGDWTVVKIKDTKNRPQEKVIEWMSFKEGGVIEAGTDYVDASGVWSYDESKKTITVKIARNPSTTFKIIKLSKKKLILENFESKIILKKAKKKH